METTINCNNCFQPVKTYLTGARFLTCSNCKRAIEVNLVNEILASNESEPIPNEVVLLKIGDAIEIKGEQFTIIGRVRHVTSNCIFSEWAIFNQKGLKWLIESNFMFFISPHDAPSFDLKKMPIRKPNEKVTFENIQYQIVEIAKEIHSWVEGEVPKDAIDSTGFYYVELVKDKKVATIRIYDKENAEIFQGDAIKISDVKILNSSLKKAKQPLISQCKFCNADIPRIIEGSALQVACSKCGCFHDGSWGPLLKSSKFESANNKAIEILLHAEGDINGVKYKVIGIIQRKSKGYNQYWNEFLLFNAEMGYSILTQYQGHWNLFREEIYFEKLERDPLAIAGGQYYKLYENYSATIVNAFGEFPFHINRSESTEVQEYINPPSCLVFEKSSIDAQFFKGEYLEPDVIKNAFALTAVPERIGVGINQPFLSSFSTSFFRRFLFVIGIALLGCQIFFHLSSSEEIVFSQRLNISDSINKKEFGTPSFNLSSGIDNVEVKLETAVDNNWTFVSVLLVNEETGDQYETNLEADYYHGYDGGESWSEGQSWASNIISSVPGGKYHLILNPIKPDNMLVSPVHITVTRDVSSWSNFFLVFLLLAIYPCYYFYRKNRFETKRWLNSDYGPDAND